MTPAPRDIVFISKGTPNDDQFVLWLAPKLEAHGYKVFADIVTLQPGDRWRKEITTTLQTKAIKMLLCCNDTTLAKDGVEEEIGIAEDLTKELDDQRFIIPLKIEAFKKVFGIGGLQYISFDKGWAQGLAKLLELLKEEGVPRDTARIAISPTWQDYRRRDEVKLEDAPEALVSNWLRVAEIPDMVRYFRPTGAIDHGAMQLACRNAPYPAEFHNRGFYSFCTLKEASTDFAEVARLELVGEWPLLEFTDKGIEKDDLKLAPREAKNIVTSMMRRAWELFCHERGLYEYAYSSLSAFHVTPELVPVKTRVKWGNQGDRRWAMLHNIAGGKMWRYGVSAIPALWPFPHYRLKARVLFADAEGKDAGKIIDDKKAQHRYRRSLCKGWRNKQWYGRLMAFLELLSGDQATISLPAGRAGTIELEAMPMILTSPVKTALPDELDDDDEESDDETFGAPVPAEEEEDESDEA